MGPCPLQPFGDRAHGCGQLQVSAAARAVRLYGHLVLPLLNTVASHFTVPRMAASTVIRVPKRKSTSTLLLPRMTIGFCGTESSRSEPAPSARRPVPLFSTSRPPTGNWMDASVPTFNPMAFPFKTNLPPPVGRAFTSQEAPGIKIPLPLLFMAVITWLAAGPKITSMLAPRRNPLPPLAFAVILLPTEASKG